MHPIHTISHCDPCEARMLWVASAARAPHPYKRTCQSAHAKQSQDVWGQKSCCHWQAGPRRLQAHRDILWPWVASAPALL